MTDRPILFSGAMIRALLAGRKTQTRRILKQQPPSGNHYGKDIMDWGLSGIYQDDDNEGTNRWWLDVQTNVDDNSHEEFKVSAAIGDRLWVRETWAPLTALTHNDPGPKAIIDGGFYRADEGTVDGEISKWKPSIFMPRHASRLTLTVTDVRVERLQDISPDDAEDEGCPPCPACDDVGWINSGPDGGWQCTEVGCGDAYVDQYARLWDSINGSGSWDANPWVVAYTFTVHHGNIDQIAEVAA